MRGVHDEDVDPGVDERFGALLRLGSDTDRGTHDESALSVLGGVRVLLALREVFDGDEAAQPTLVVHERKLFDLVGAQQSERFLAGDADRGGDQRHGGHDLADRTGAVLFETHVPVGDDPDEAPVVVDHGGTGDPVVGAEPFHVGERVVGVAGHRVGDHPRFGAFDQVDLGGLVLDREVAVQDSGPALPSDRHGHPRLGHGVHRRGDQRDAQGDIAGETGGRVRLARLEIRVRGYQQDIVIGEPGREHFLELLLVSCWFERHDTFQPKRQLPLPHPRAHEPLAVAGGRRQDSHKPQGENSAQSVRGTAQPGQCAVLGDPDRAGRHAEGVPGLVRGQARDHAQGQEAALLFGECAEEFSGLFCFDDADRGLFRSG